MSAEVTPPKLRVLVADDDPAVLAILAHGLEAAGAEVVTAGDGATALRKLVDHLLGLDLLVTDLEMPGLDGVALVRIVRAEGGERELPILVLAGKVGERQRSVLLELGVTEILEKGQGSEHAVRRAVELATLARRAAGASDPGADPAVRVAAIRLTKAPVRVRDEA